MPGQHSSSCRRSFEDEMLGGGISRKLVGNICPAVTWRWFRASGSALAFPCVSVPFCSLGDPQRK